MDISRRILFQSNPDLIFLDFILNPIFPSRMLLNGTRETLGWDWLTKRNNLIYTYTYIYIYIGELKRRIPMRQLEISTRSIHFRPDENEEDPVDSKATKVRFSFLFGGDACRGCSFTRVIEPNHSPFDSDQSNLSSHLSVETMPPRYRLESR